MDRITFTVVGDPITWKRAEHGGDHKYTREAVAEQQERVRAAARQAGIREYLRGALALRCHVFRAGVDPWDIRFGDFDNHAKLAADALQGIAYSNDCVIVDGGAVKHRDDSDPRLEVELAVLYAIPERPPRARRAAPRDDAEVQRRAGLARLLSPKRRANLFAKRLQPSTRRFTP